MTGFARVTKQLSEGELVFSVKSVNHRGLDVHFHVPAEMEELETDLRGILKSGIARGHLQVNISFARTASAAPPQVNRELLDSYLRAFRETADRHHLAGQPDLNAALSLPGMLGGARETELEECVIKAVLESAREATAGLNAVRDREGATTAAEIRQRTRAIYSLVDRMQEIRAGAVPVFQKRLREKLADLLQGAGVDPQRLAQEAAILADRSDISEELLRLRTHTEQLDEMLDKGGEVGKRLDFLLQEMNRETNTVLSKTGGLGDLGLTITELALSAKSEIDKIREQSLNLE
jgi:uncharacterized protein (TIGR00255 family)